MSAPQFENFRRLKSLLRQLKSFGLNPNDWHVDRTISIPSHSGQGTMQLRHREDASFILKGDLSPNARGFVRIHSLMVASL